MPNQFRANTDTPITDSVITISPPNTSNDIAVVAGDTRITLAGYYKIVSP